MSLTIYLPKPPRDFRRALADKSANSVAIAWAIRTGVVTRQELHDLNWQLRGRFRLEPDA